MASKLADGECSRKRQRHPSGTSSKFPAAAQRQTRPSFVFLKCSNDLETRYSSVSFTRNKSKEGYHHNEEKLKRAAMEAKERLDEKLKNLRYPDYIRKNTIANTSIDDVPKKAGGGGGGGLRRLFVWLGCRAVDPVDSAVCSERFKAGPPVPLRLVR